MNKKILIPIIVIILAAGIGALFIFQKPAFPDPENIRDSFFEVHMEPSNANEEMFKTLTEFVNLADQYNVKLTLLFTPQWAEMVLKDSEKLSLLSQWKSNGHEIGGHHHGPSVCPWDGYTNLGPDSQEFKSRQNRVPCPPFVREKERYLGAMDDYLELLNKLGPIKTITMSDEDVDWPEGALYAAGGRRLQGAISNPKIVNFSGYEVYKLTSAPLEPRKSPVTGILITIDELKREYLSEKEGIFGVGAHEISYRDNPDLYKQWFEFLKEQDPEMNHSKTISQIIEERVSSKQTDEEKQSSQDSPFGIHGPFESQIDSPHIVTSERVKDHLKDLGVKWVRESYFNKDLDNISEIVNIYSGIGFEGGKINPKIIDIPESYKQELRKVIQKNKDKIKIWHVQTEPDGIGGWFDNPRGYANLLKASFEVVKQECPNCKVSIGGLSGGGGAGFGIDSKAVIFLKNVLEAGGAGYFDVFEFKRHHYSSKQYLELGKKMEAFRKILAVYNIDIDKMPVFIETAMYDGNPNDPVPKLLEKDLPIQTEKDQAIGLVKTYVYGLSIGIDKIFWNLIYERTDFEIKYHKEPFPQNPFNHYGLINNPGNNDGLSHKKLSYYTYKKMVEVLEGSDWDNIQTIQEKDGIYIYKFTKQGKPIRVAWNDNAGSKQIIIPNIPFKEVKITEAVPKYNSGKEATDYATAFNHQIKKVENGKIAITLKEVPVFMEEE